MRGHRFRWAASLKAPLAVKWLPHRTHLRARTSTVLWGGCSLSVSVCHPGCSRACMRRWGVGGCVPVLVEPLLAVAATHKLLEQLPHEAAAAHGEQLSDHSICEHQVPDGDRIAQEGSAERTPPRTHTARNPDDQQPSRKVGAVISHQYPAPRPPGLAAGWPPRPIFASINPWIAARVPPARLVSSRCCKGTPEQLGRSFGAGRAHEPRYALCTPVVG